MATTYKLISKVTVGSGGAANIEFTSIPGTYTDLVVKVSARDTSSATATSINLSLNNSTSSFTTRILYGTGSSTVSTTSTNYVVSTPSSLATASTFGNSEFYIPNYTSSNNKSYSSDVVTENNATEAFAYLVAGLWSNSAAITSIKLTPATGTLVQYSTARLYGIKNS